MILVGTFFMFVSQYFAVNIGPAQLLFLVTFIFYSIYSLIGRFSFWLIIKYLFASIFSLILYIILGFGFSLLIVFSSP